MRCRGATRARKNETKLPAIWSAPCNGERGAFCELGSLFQYFPLHFLALIRIDGKGQKCFYFPLGAFLVKGSSVHLFVCAVLGMKKRGRKSRGTLGNGYFCLHFGVVAFAFRHKIAL
jgi:hypothetical protein